jgi:pimeloyl-ACP methyl ester carboxylesterase
LHFEHTLHIEGHRLQALEYNPQHGGTPLIFIHGITASNAMWYAGQTPLIRDHYHWYTLSLPGHFPATFPPGHSADEVNAQTHARIMGAAVRKLVGEKPVVLVGHSTGGFAALNIAANASDTVNTAGLIVVAGFAHGRWIGPLGLLQQMVRHGGPVGRAMFRLNMRSLGSNYRLFKTSISLYAVDKKAFFAHPHAEVTFANLYPNIKQIDARAMQHYFQQMPDIDISADIERISAPALIIAGGKDPVVPPKQARHIADRLEAATLHMIPGIGHLPMSERGEQYDALITDWMQAHFPPG